MYKTPTCWLWVGAQDQKGYGIFTDENGKIVRAHRWLWKQEHGSIPLDYDLHHNSDCPKNCVIHVRIVPHTTHWKIEIKEKEFADRK